MLNLKINRLRQTIYFKRNYIEMALDKEKQKLFKQVRSKLGGGVRKIELTDEQLCDLLDLAIGDYAERVQNFIIENNWANLYGKNMSNTDLAYALSVRTLDITKDYSYYFSKEVGLQQRGPWELKKDFFKIESGKQVYMIPAGREINKVLWLEPSITDAAIWANYGGFGVSFGGGVTGQMGLGAATAFGGMGSAYGMGAGLWALPFADVTAMSMDLSYKNQFLRSDLTYKVTAGPDGTHLIHLMSTPGSKLTFGAGGVGLFPLKDCHCWYTYYDVTSDNVDECRKQNPDVILSPDQIPLDEMEYAYLNSPTKALVRQLLIAEAAETLAFIRGKFSGNINMIASPLTMDYAQLMSFGNREKDAALKTLDERLQRMSPYEVMKRQAELVESMIQAKKGVPLPIMVI